ncbi:lethal(2) giant larvae protein [Eupeodes corollae]|uniref:lethal(2) giant larvae protein n=1 Tax=Eupeodes corollae TaxID=290404 RepID=UPI002490F910|nr:lethal(2) giant larvae protein [Eupeodes corollae]XP_055916624.1 lethal(2) giant larvae protein [Eupeodes corollae]XP_055916625.1 lethal(2) giant larvae protein [Eupeodes corollae]XP_055916626.1 lethal(2) giant larvae protein [Eupeodes corollae]
MLKFIRGKGQQPTAERQRLQKELFAYRKTAQHGFPHKPSALAFDSKSKLMAVGTQNGAIKVFGQPGIEFYGHHTMQSNSAADLNVQLLEWVHGSGNLLSLTASNQLILWEPVGSTLVAIKSLSFDGKLKKVSSLCCSHTKNIVWIGTEGGNIYQLDLKDFSVKEPAIYHDVVLEQVPPSYKLNPGAIECIKQIPNASNQLLVAYNRGLCVLWDTDTSAVVRSFIAPGHGQSVGLHINAEGTEFTWYHADGSFASWDLNDSDPPMNLNYVPYGPDPCKSINRLYKGTRGSDKIVVFSGGMPRSAYGDHNCVSIHVNNENKVCFDFTSKVIDFFVTYENNSDAVEVLVVLLEEELCAYDLKDPKFPVIKAPYLHSLHASAVTCNQLISQVSKKVFEKINKAGQEQDAGCSDLAWPVTGGVWSETYDLENEESEEYEIMLTGHEDGSVKFWNCTDIVMTPIYHLKTSILFGHENQENIHGDSSESIDDSEPPFRKAGLFDPYSDDPRLAVKKLSLCPKTGKIIIGGTAGQIIIASFEENCSEKSSLKVSTMNLVSDRDGFVWKGHDQLNVRPNLLIENADPVGDPGVEISGILQVLPPASITCLALQTDWNLVSGGTAHGLVLFDFKNFLPVFHRCTLNPNDLTGAGEQLSRRKSFKKSLRESFRKLRKGRSTRNNPTQPATTLDARPVERQVEARSPDDGMGSMVRCLVFAKTYITNVHTTAATLWSATNASCVSVFLLHLPPPQENNADQSSSPRRVSAQLAKEIQMKHRAPVVGIVVFDHTGVPLELNGPKTPPHRVLIASEEQFKIFSLPQLKPITKYKLTAHEGARVRRLAFASFTCRVPLDYLQGSPTKSTKSEIVTDRENVEENNGEIGPETRDYHEVGLLCLTNLGDILVLSIPELKRQLNAAAVRREDINGISSLCFTNFGEALYMMSSSELQRISLATAKVVTPKGRINVEHLDGRNADENSINEQETMEADSTESINKPINKEHITLDSNAMTNGLDGSPNRGNETISSSMGDITVDSVRDHLNATTTTLCSTTTEETVGRLSVLSSQTSQTITNANMRDITDFNIPNLMDLAPLSNTTETTTSSVVIKSVITSISHEKTNGESDTITSTKTTTREESQF